MNSEHKVDININNSTYTVQGSDPSELSEKLSQKYSALADFLTANKLKVNDDKTHLLVMSTRQKKRHREPNSILSLSESHFKL